MKHIFILNPVAGGGKAEQKLLPEIIKTAKRLGIDYEIHRTINKLDAERFTRAKLEARKEIEDYNDRNDIYRFYACGGDGTLNEVVNGIVGEDRVEIANIPWGSGNDFLRNFNVSKKILLDIESQIKAQARPVDVAKCVYETQEDGEIEKYFINIVNIGLDCTVAYNADKMRENSYVPRKFAYMLSLVEAIGKKETISLNIKFDDGSEISEKNLLLIAAGNGAYYGGGFKAVAAAEIDDGYLDMIIVKDVSRIEFASLASKYKKGTHLEDSRAKKIFAYKKCKGFSIDSEETIEVCSDGEVIIAEKIKVDIIALKIMFSVPTCE